MKLRLTQAGFENYTGQMGVVMFKDGLSETDVLPIDGVRIAAAIGAEWEDGNTPNKGEMYLTVADAPAHVGVPGGSNEESASTSSDGVQASGAPGGVVYSEADLAKIADDKGIAGLREIGDPIGAKGTSIVGLIAEILKKQGGQPQAE